MVGVPIVPFAFLSVAFQADLANAAVASENCQTLFFRVGSATVERNKIGNGFV